MSHSIYSVSSFTESDLSDNFTDDIRELKNLKDGWDFGDGIAISQDVIHNACYLYNHLNRPEFKYSCSPLSNGGIKITCQFYEDFIDLDINKDLSIDLIHEVGIGADYEVEYERKAIRIDDIEKYINQFLLKACFSSERYTSESIILTRKGSTAIASKTSMVVSPYSIWNVQLKPVIASPII